MKNFQEAETVVRRFLAALEAREMETAAGMLAPGAKIVFPGPQPFKNLDDLIPFARQRYQWVRKTIEGVDTASLPGGEIVVYVRGQLYGLNLHEEEFSGVRFIDRFVLKDGLIMSQEVWNDLAESRVLDR